MPFVKRLTTPEADQALAELAEIATESDRLTIELNALAIRREQAIRRASQAGATRRAVAAATGLSAGRIQQIVAADG